MQFSMTERMLPVNTGDCLIEVTTWTCLTACFAYGGIFCLYHNIHIHFIYWNGA